MTSQDNKDHVDSPEIQTKPARASDHNADEPTELTVQELEERIAPLVRKAGGLPLDY